MFSRLAAPLEARLELASPSRNNQNPDVGLRRATDHMRDVVLVARRVEDRVALRLGLEGRPTDLYRFTFRTLLFVRVHDKREEPRLAVALLRFSFVLFYGSLINISG